jgi:Bacterial self-protective colicin-like immunity
MSPDNVAAERMTAKYRNLISGFINHRISAEEFQSSYFMLFKNDEDQVPGSEFKTLDKLFADADDYTADPELRKRRADWMMKNCVAVRVTYIKNSTNDREGAELGTAYRAACPRVWLWPFPRWCGHEPDALKLRKP